MKQQENRNLTTGNVTKKMLLFAAPMIAGNLLQQFYNIADTFVVGKGIGAGALASVGAAYSLMTFLTSIIIGLCMGSGAVFSFYFGKKEKRSVLQAMQAAFLFIGGITVVLFVTVYAFCNPILILLKIPEELMGMMETYVRIVFCGIPFVFLYNYFAFVLRSVGNSITPLFYLGGASILNVVLDVWFVIGLHKGISGAAVATLISQVVAGLGLGIYTWTKELELRFPLGRITFTAGLAKEIVHYSFAASIQQSVMNFGILMIQGLVNSFGAAVMAAFAATVKIDTFAYMPAQSFADSYSLFISQNNGAGEQERIRKGTRRAIQISLSFCALVSTCIFVFAKQMMLIFVKASETEIINIGIGYLRIEGAFYVGIGLLFLLYGYFRGNGKPMVSLLLTIVSLGTRVLLAYSLAPALGVTVIWWAIPIGWFLADITGLLLMKKIKAPR